MPGGAFGSPRIDQRCERKPASLRMTIAGCHEDPGLDVEVADHAELGPEDPELGDALKDDAALERVAEHAPACPDATASDPHRMDLFGILAVDRPGDPGEHPREVEAEDLSTGFGPRVVRGDLRCACECEVIRGSERGRGSFGARDERRRCLSPRSDRP